MKLLNADKLVEFIDSKTYKYKGIMKTTINIKDLLSFISTNSIEVEQIKPKGIVEINDEIMEREYENYLDAIYIHKADVKDKLIAERIHQDLKAEQAYMEQVNVKTTDKNCKNCGQIKDERCRGRWTNVCENWTPKLDKVEGEKTNE